MSLKNLAGEKILDLDVADSFWSRAKGLLGSSEISSDRGLWIDRCNSIHTFFMKYSIDCVFLDRELKVVGLKKQVSPWKVTWPVWSATSVIEIAAGLSDKKNIQLGDRFYVGS